MVPFTTRLLKFEKQGEKTGWTYIVVPHDIAESLKPGNKKSFRVKGTLDQFPIRLVALLPMGDGTFIMAVNASMRKGISKKVGAMVKVMIEADASAIRPSKDFLDCLGDEPAALDFFHQLPKGHQNYFSKWIESAKTAATKTKRIALAVNALAKGDGFPEMMRAEKKRKEDLGF
ncbi:MAG: DUF1905 domain-containing protein [Terrimonas sp.]|nr:DUF1905 domain-containing protein [Terrimonas sp.]